MLWSDVVCFIVLTITVTATCSETDRPNTELVGKRIGRRDKREAIIITGYPPNNHKINKFNQRASKLRYWQKKPKRGSLQPLYAPPPPAAAPNRITVKKYKKKQIRSKYNKYSSKRNAKPRYPAPAHKLYYGRPPQRPPKSQPQPYYPQEPVGFGEPPKELAQEYVQPPKQSYGEPPVDSYGNPLPNSFPTDLLPFETPSSTLNDAEQQFQSLQNFHRDANIDANSAYSKHHPVYAKPEYDPIEEYDHEESKKYSEIKLDSYADIYNQKPKHQESQNLKKYKAWNGKLKTNDYEDHVVVGGKYAEPPGRLVPNYQQEEQHHAEPSQDSYIESALVSTSSISPYINYKHSNMAFSPQNLNDAFSAFNN